MPPKKIVIKGSQQIHDLEEKDKPLDLSQQRFPHENLVQHGQPPSFVPALPSGRISQENQTPEGELVSLLLQEGDVPLVTLARHSLPNPSQTSSDFSYATRSYSFSQEGEPNVPSGRIIRESQVPTVHHLPQTSSQTSGYSYATRSDYSYHEDAPYVPSAGIIGAHQATTSEIKNLAKHDNRTINPQAAGPSNRDTATGIPSTVMAHHLPQTTSQTKSSYSNVTRSDSYSYEDVPSAEIIRKCQALPRKKQILAQHDHKTINPQAAGPSYIDKSTGIQPTAMAYHLPHTTSQTKSSYSNVTRSDSYSYEDVPSAEIIRKCQALPRKKQILAQRDHKTINPQTVMAYQLPQTVSQPKRGYTNVTRSDSYSHEDAPDVPSAGIIRGPQAPKRGKQILARHEYQTISPQAAGPSYRDTSLGIPPTVMAHQLPLTASQLKSGYTNMTRSHFHEGALDVPGAGISIECQTSTSEVQTLVPVDPTTINPQAVGPSYRDMSTGISPTVVTAHNLPQTASQSTSGYSYVTSSDGQSGRIISERQTPMHKIQILSQHENPTIYTQAPGSSSEKSSLGYLDMKRSVSFSQDSSCENASNRPIQRAISESNVSMARKYSQRSGCTESSLQHAVPFQSSVLHEGIQRSSLQDEMRPESSHTTKSPSNSGLSKIPSGSNPKSSHVIHTGASSYKLRTQGSPIKTFPSNIPHRSPHKETPEHGSVYKGIQRSSLQDKMRPESSYSTKSPSDSGLSKIPSGSNSKSSHVIHTGASSYKLRTQGSPIKTVPSIIPHRSLHRETPDHDSAKSSLQSPSKSSPQQVAAGSFLQPISPKLSFPMKRSPQKSLSLQTSLKLRRTDQGWSVVSTTDHPQEGIKTSLDPGIVSASKKTTYSNSLLEIGMSSPNALRFGHASPTDVPAKKIQYGSERTSNFGRLPRPKEQTNQPTAGAKKSSSRHSKQILTSATSEIKAGSHPGKISQHSSDVRAATRSSYRENKGSSDSEIKMASSSKSHTPLATTLKPASGTAGQSSKSTKKNSIAQNSSSKAVKSLSKVKSSDNTSKGMATTSRSSKLIPKLGSNPSQKKSLSQSTIGSKARKSLSKASSSNVESKRITRSQSRRLSNPIPTKLDSSSFKKDERSQAQSSSKAAKSHLKILPSAAGAKGVTKSYRRHSTSSIITMTKDKGIPMNKKSLPQAASDSHDPPKESSSASPPKSATYALLNPFPAKSSLDYKSNKVLASQPSTSKKKGLQTRRGSTEKSSKPIQSKTYVQSTLSDIAGNDSIPNEEHSQPSSDSSTSIPKRSFRQAPHAQNKEISKRKMVGPAPSAHQGTSSTAVSKLPCKRYSTSSISTLTKNKGIPKAKKFQPQVASVPHDSPKESSSQSSSPSPPESTTSASLYETTSDSIWESASGSIPEKLTAGSTCQESSKGLSPKKPDMGSHLKSFRKSIHAVSPINISEPNQSSGRVIHQGNMQKRHNLIRSQAEMLKLDPPKIHLIDLKSILFYFPSFLEKKTNPCRFASVNRPRSLSSLANHGFAKLLVGFTASILRSYWGEDYHYDDEGEVDEDDPDILNDVDAQEERICPRERSMIRMLRLVRAWFMTTTMNLRLCGYMDVISDGVLEVLDCIPPHDCEPFHRLTIQLLFCQKVGWLGHGSTIEMYGVESCKTYARFLKLFIPFHMTSFNASALTFVHPAPFSVMLKYADDLDVVHTYVDQNRLFMDCLGRFCKGVKEIYFDSRMADENRVPEERLYLTFFGDMGKPWVLAQVNNPENIVKTFNCLTTLTFNFPSAKYFDFIYCVRYFYQGVTMEFVRCVNYPIYSNAVIQSLLDMPGYLKGRMEHEIKTVEFEINTDLFIDKHDDDKSGDSYPNVHSTHFLYKVKELSDHNRLQFSELLKLCNSERVVCRMPNIDYTIENQVHWLEYFDVCGCTLKELHLQLNEAMTVYNLIDLLNSCSFLEIFSLDVPGFIHPIDLEDESYSLKTLFYLEKMSLHSAEWVKFDPTYTEPEVSLIAMLMDSSPSLTDIEFCEINSTLINALLPRTNFGNISNFYLSASSPLFAYREIFIKLSRNIVLKLYNPGAEEFNYFKYSLKNYNIDVEFCELKHIGLKNPYSERQ